MQIVLINYDPPQIHYEYFIHYEPHYNPHSVSVHRVQLWALLLFIIADRDGLRKPKPVNAARKFSTRCTLCF